MEDNETVGRFGGWLLSGSNYGKFGQRLRLCVRGLVVIAMIFVIGMVLRDTSVSHQSNDPRAHVVYSDGYRQACDGTTLVRLGDKAKGVEVIKIVDSSECVSPSVRPVVATVTQPVWQSADRWEITFAVVILAVGAGLILYGILWRLLLEPLSLMLVNRVVLRKSRYKVFLQTGHYRDWSISNCR